MLQSNFLNQQERRYKAMTRKLYLERALHALKNLVLTLVFTFGFAMFAYMAGHLPSPINDPNFPLPSWTWTASLVTVALGCMCTAGYFLFAMLDECFYPKHSRQRLTGRR